MDRTGLIEATARKAADGGAAPSHEEVGRIVDALFGTVEKAGTIAETLRAGGTVTLLGFGDFHVEESGAVLRPGRALDEYLSS